jgi:hypothetical protein
MKPFRALFIALLFTLSFVARPPRAAALDEITPPANPGAEVQQIRRELEALRNRLDQLERAPRAPSARPVDEAGERARLLAETQQVLAQYRVGKTAAWKQTRARIRELRREVTAALETMQADYTRRTRLDEAVAIRDAIRCLAEIGRKVQPDPGRLPGVGATSEVLFFRVTGAKSGSLYGTGIYTSDSHLATAAVHAGILKQEQTGVMKVTTIPSHPNFVGSTQNGITSSSWSSYPGFRVEALDEEDLDLADNEPPAAGATTTPAPPICAPPKPAPESNDPFGPSTKRVKPAGPSEVTWPAALPPEAREQLEGHLAMIVELRKATREKVALIAAETVSRLTAIQNAHTRAARLDEAISIRDQIRQLTPVRPETN